MAPNIVLVHGALADGSSWSSVISELQSKKYTNVWAVQQPLSSIPDDIAKVSQALDWIPGPVVLVGHSFGGMVVTNAGNHPKVKALVYVSAFTPDINQSVTDLSKGFPELPAGKAFQFDQQGRFYLNSPEYAKYFCPDLPLKQARQMAATQGLTDGARFGWKSGPAAWKNKPSYCVIAGRDQIIPPELLEWQATNIKAKKSVTIPNASHALLIVHAKKVAQIIIDAANAVAKDN
ncbi:hypothetical protein BGZ73_009197 [Actinomortierella ambigua]|nr:hypothetical protein BGZ73_009197 [Actinomortierella ambigua]